jgi:hypothetical protein
MISLRYMQGVLVALSVLVIAAPSARANPREPIALARHRALGSTVTVRGAVSVQTNAFDAGFAIQQLGAGIYVLDSGDRARALGDEVEVTGTLVDSFGLLAIDPSSITAHGHGVVVPVRRDTGDVGEATEGRLLRLEGQMVGDIFDDGPFGFIIHIDDGSGAIQLFLFPGANISTAGLQAGVTIRVTCFSNQFDTTFECDPRSPADFEIRPPHEHH